MGGYLRGASVRHLTIPSSRPGGVLIPQLAQ